MNGNGHIAEHGFGRVVATVINSLNLVQKYPIRSIESPQVALLLLVDHFEVADGGLAAGHQLTMYAPR